MRGTGGVCVLAGFSTAWGIEAPPLPGSACPPLLSTQQRQDRAPRALAPGRQNRLLRGAVVEGSHCGLARLASDMIVEAIACARAISAPDRTFVRSSILPSILRSAMFLFSHA